MTAAPDIAPYADTRSFRDTGLDIARGVAMVLVVFGHALDGVHAAGQDTYVMRLVMTVIYTSHVPFLFLASGMLAWRMIRRPLPEFLGTLWNKVIWPYLLWALILLTLLFMLSAHTNTELSMYQPLSILWRAPAVLWFLYVLALGIVTLRVLSQESGTTILCIGLLCLLVPYGWEPFPQKARFLGMFLIGAGIGAAVLHSALTPRGLTLASAVMGMTICYAIADAVDPLTGYPAYKAAYIPALFAGPALIYAVGHRLAQGGRAHELARIGRSTMAIFVTHILFTAGLRIVLTRFGVTDWWMIVLCATYAGVLIPLLAAEQARRRGFSRYLGWS